jgi:hypothetical protein
MNDTISYVRLELQWFGSPSYIPGHNHECHDRGNDWSFTRVNPVCCSWRNEEGDGKTKIYETGYIEKRGGESSS